MTFEIFLVLAFLVVAMVLFTFEWLSIDIVTLCLLGKRKILSRRLAWDSPELIPSSQHPSYDDLAHTG